MRHRDTIFIYAVVSFLSSPPSLLAQAPPIDPRLKTEIQPILNRELEGWLDPSMIDSSVTCYAENAFRVLGNWSEISANWHPAGRLDRRCLKEYHETYKGRLLTVRKYVIQRLEERDGVVMALMRLFGSQKNITTNREEHVDGRRFIFLSKIEKQWKIVGVIDYLPKDPKEP
jgi:hypothetical protein